MYVDLCKIWMSFRTTYNGPNVWAFYKSDILPPHTYIAVLGRLTEK